MIVVYDSLTGCTKKFALEVDPKAIDIKDIKEVEDDVLLCTRNTNFGEVTKEAKDFLDKYAHKVRGVIVSGNKNWGSLYGKAAEVIKENYNVPVFLVIELSGSKEDREKTIEFLERNYGKNYHG